MNKSTTIFQDAIRLLYILVNGSESFIEENSLVRGKFKGKMRLYAMDFWMRYPDYLAHELLFKYEETEQKRYFELAEEIFNKNEPDLRRIPMIRYLFGAYEKLDNTLSILISKGLIKQTGIKSSSHIQKYEFWIFQKAFELINMAKIDFPILDWYDKRSKIIVEIVGQRGGAALKNRQYKHIEYAKTKLGGVIPSIKDEVLLKIEKLNKF